METVQSPAMTADQAVLRRTEKINDNKAASPDAAFTEEIRTMKRQEVMKLVEQGVAELNEALRRGHSETLVDYLRVLSRFHHYSFNNAILIAVQRPDATHVAGFHRWKQLGRFVNKGEKGIAILAPMVCRKKDGDGDGPLQDKADEARFLAGFKVVHVFDVSQTDGEGLPEFAQIHGDPGDKLSSLEQLVRDSGVELEYDFIGNGASGASQKGRIVIRPDLSSAETFAVLVHELSHELLHQQTDRKQETTRTVRETEAEAIAHVVCQAFGLDGTTRCSDYIQLYRGDTKTLGESLDHIQKTATHIIQHLDGTARNGAVHRSRLAA